MLDPQWLAKMTPLLQTERHRQTHRQTHRQMRTDALPCCIGGLYKYSDGDTYRASVHTVSVKIWYSTGNLLHNDSSLLLRQCTMLMKQFWQLATIAQLHYQIHFLYTLAISSSSSSAAAAAAAAAGMLTRTPFRISGKGQALFLHYKSQG